MSGINITPNQAQLLNELVQVSITQISGDANLTLIQGEDTASAQALQTKIYRPSTWAGGKSQKYQIVVPAQSSNSAVDSNGTMTVTTVGSTSYVFDAMLTADHTSDAELTKYPVQTGANASYNAILKPKVLILEVAMSDAIDAYKAGMWVGNLSKSVSAWQTMVSLQAARVFLTVNTRLQTYTNMLLKSITSKDDKKTFSGGLHMVLTFEQVFTSTVAQKQISSRPNATNSNNLAISQGASVPNSVTNNYKLPDTPVSNFIDAPDLSNSYGTTESPGLWSSNNIGTIPSTLGAPQP